jgi:hypothetical protein
MNSSEAAQRPSRARHLRTAAIAVAAVAVALVAFRIGTADPTFLGIRAHAWVHALAPSFVGLALFFGIRSFRNTRATATASRPLSELNRSRLLAASLAIGWLIVLLGIALSVARVVVAFGTTE